MKDRQNQKWCLACGTVVVTREEFDATKHVNVAHVAPVAKIPSLELEQQKSESSHSQYVK